MRSRLPWIGLVILSACAEERNDVEPRFGSSLDSGVALVVEAEPREVALMGAVRVTLDLWTAAAESAEFEPAIPDGFVGALEGGAGRAWNGGEWRRYVLALRPTRVGEVEIPAFEARSGEAVATSAPIVIAVTSALDVAPPDVADPEVVEAPAPPFPLRPPIWPWLIAGAALLVIVSIVVAWRRRSPVGPAPAVEIPPEVRARRALARLRGMQLEDPAAIEAFYVGVSQVLRVYLEQRFGLHAPERTTEEFLPEVERSGVLGAEQRHELRRFLQQCDLVKFAAMYPEAAAHTRTLGAAEALVEATASHRMGGAA